MAEFLSGLIMSIAYVVNFISVSAGIALAVSAAIAAVSGLVIGVKYQSVGLGISIFIVGTLSIFAAYFMLALLAIPFFATVGRGILMRLL